MPEPGKPRTLACIRSARSLIQSSHKETMKAAGFPHCPHVDMRHTLVPRR